MTTSAKRDLREALNKLGLDLTRFRRQAWQATGEVLMSIS